MQATQTITPAQKLASLALAALMTTLMLFSVGLQADARHADALASAKGSSQQAGAEAGTAPQRNTRG